MIHVFVYVTCESQAQAESIGHIMVEQGFAACANIMSPMNSIYKWENEIQHSEEIPLVLKTTEALFSKLEAAIKEVHSYDNPCIVALPITKASKEFLGWINENTIKP